MHRLKELVRLHRMGRSSREIARQLRMGRDTIRCYLRGLRRAGLLEGAVDELPELDELRAGVPEQVGSKQAPAQVSSVERWRDPIRRLRVDKGAGPKAIFDWLRLHEPDFDGSLSAVKRLCLQVDRVEGPKPTDVAIPVETDPGEIAQVDFVFAGKRYDPERGIMRKTWLFVMTLGFSRHMYCELVFDQRVETWVWLHVQAFEYFGGVPRVIVYDNLKSAVLERRGDAIRFNPLLIEFANHYRYEPRPVAVRRGNEKGRVERAVRFVRSSFWPARRWHDVDDLNAQAIEWCRTRAAERPWVQDRKKSVAQVFGEEQQKLLELPATPFVTEERVEVRVAKTPFVRFDLNDYSVPHTLVRRTVEVRATLDRVRVLFEGRVVAVHPRSFDRDREIEDPAHTQALRREKGEGRAHRAIDRIAQAVPASGELFRRLADRGENLGRATQLVGALLDQYGSRRLEAAIREGLERGVLHVHGLRQILEKARMAEGRPPKTAVVLPDDERVRGLAVSPHELADYDDLIEEAEEDDGEKQQ